MFVLAIAALIFLEVGGLLAYAVVKFRGNDGREPAQVYGSTQIELAWTGQRGPALDSVATRLTNDQLIRQVIQGGGNMPAYGNNLSPAETTALVAFLETLHPGMQGSASDAAEDVALKGSERKAGSSQR